MGMEIALIPMSAIVMLVGLVVIAVPLLMYATEKVPMMNQYVQDKDHVFQTINVNVNKIGLVNNVRLQHVLECLEINQLSAMETENVLIPMCVAATQDGEVMIVVYKNVMENLPQIHHSCVQEEVHV
jgi:hypothetical protein